MESCVRKITDHHLTPNCPPQNFAWCSEMVWTSSWIHIAPLTQEGKVFQLGPENTSFQLLCYITSKRNIKTEL